MKMLKKLPLTMAIASVLMSAHAMADSWKVTQSSDLTNLGVATTLQQTSTTTSSYQALNNINLDTTNGAVGNSGIGNGSTQTVTTSGTSDLTLQQTDGTTLSYQAANRAAAHTITQLDQVVNAGGKIILDQDGAGASNVQALNDAETTGTNSSIIGLDQALNAVATATATIQLNQGNTSATGKNNRQAINRVKSDDIDGLTQKIIGSTDVSLFLDQGNSVAGGIQAGNLIETTGSIATGVTQEVTVKEADFSQSSSGNSIQAANAVSLGDGVATTGGEISQTFTPDKLSMTQSTASGSIQSGNYIGVALAAP